MNVERFAEIHRLLVNINLDNLEETIELINNSIIVTSEFFYDRLFYIILQISFSFYSKINLYISLFCKLKLDYNKLCRRNILCDASPLLARLLPGPIHCGIYNEKNVDLHLKFKVLPNNPEILLYYLPEISPEEIDIIKNSYLSGICDQFIEDHKNGKFIQYRMEAVNRDPIAKLIREDNITEFDNLLKKNEIEFDTPIPFSVYERGKLVSDPLFRPTPILYAAYYGAEKIFNYLFEDYDDSFELLFPYVLLGNNHNIISTVVRSNPDFNMNVLSDYSQYLLGLFFDSENIDQIGLDHENLFINLVLSHNVNMLNELYDIDIHKMNNKGKKIFQICWQEHPYPYQSTIFYENYDFNFFIKDNNGDNPAHIAAMEGKSESLRNLVVMIGSDVITPDNNGVTPIQYAIKSKDDLSILVITQFITTPLEYVSEEGSCIFVGINNYEDLCFEKLVFNNDIDLTKLSPNCKLPYQFAMEKENLDAFLYIVTSLNEQDIAFDSNNPQSVICNVIDYSSTNPIFLESLLKYKGMERLFLQPDSNGILI